ncbi:MAG: phosphoadenosine phosphosulfate reductase, partial [Akkermansiaceae bacterium]
MMKISQSSSNAVLSNDPSSKELSAILEPLKASERILQLKEIYGSRLVASSSFGVQASVMLHLIKEHAPEIPIIF